MDNLEIEKTAKWGVNWQSSRQWEPHTMGPEQATAMAEYYLKLIHGTSGWAPVLGVSRGLDLGAGAGYLAESLRQSGILMTASEWNDIGINLINDLNPKLPTRKIDVLAFSDPDAWDLIICREVYPFTRVNAFTDQLKIVASLIDSLRSGGVLVLTGSDVAYPHCMNWSLLIDVLKKDHRLSIVSGRHSEAIGRRPTVWMFGYSSYCVMGALLRPFIIMKKMFTRWADIGVIILRKQ